MIPIWRVQPVFILLIAGCATAPPAQTPPASNSVAAPAAKPVVNAESADGKAPAPAPAKSSPAPAKTVAIAKAQASPPVAPKAAAAPTLDIKSLEDRLKETKAIGVMTKITLKNQVDDLLQKFRDYYAGRLKTTLSELRQPYELLLMKVITLLQDADAPLAAAIHGSREAIWAMLSDRDKFSKLA